MLTTLGVLIMDMFPSELGLHLGDVPLWKPVCGGAPANVAVANARMGGTSAFIGKIGNDLFGERLRQELVDERIDVTGLHVDEYARTTMNFHAKPYKDVIEYCFYRNPGADTTLKESEVNTEAISKSFALHYDALCLTDEPAKSAASYAVSFARECGTLVSFDMNYRQPLWENETKAVDEAVIAFKTADIVKINETEAALLSEKGSIEQAAKIILDYGVKLVVVTLGSEGSYYSTKAYSGYVEASDDVPIDTVGCGDTFIAGVLNRIETLGKGLDITQAEMCEIFRFATQAAGITATKVGVFSSMPTLAEINNRLR